MADRTSSTTFFKSCDPTTISGVTNASDGDSFVVPYGTLSECLVGESGDNDAIPSATASGSTVTLGLVDDEGAAVNVDTDIIFTAFIKVQ
jgi:hypothetical protein